ncbi:MAG: hypothetical protein ACI8S6_005002 [Myxococcota bacterium]|jgi:hypothetical protein
MPSLERLLVSGCEQLDEAALAVLQKALPGCRI